MAQANTIGGPGGQVDINFTAGGSQYSLSYVDTLVGAIDNILNNGGTITSVSANTSGAAYFPGTQVTQSDPIYLLSPSTVQVGLQTFDIETPGYVIATIGGNVALNGDSAGGDTVIVVGVSPQTTVNTFASDNLIVFIDGNNTYDGAGSTGGDTVVGGTGNDMITTGAGNTTVNAGGGYDIITLNDSGAGYYNDQVYLDSGHAQVYADGTGDYVVATTEGQTVSGAASPLGSGAALTVVLLPNSDGTANGNDLINAGGAYTNVIDESSNNTVNGGSGGLTFIGGGNVTASINIGGSTALIFGNTGDNLIVGDIAGSTFGAVFSAGGGNETLNGAAANGNLLLFGAGQVDGVGATDSLIGGAGNDTLVGGAGAETLIGGAGANTFLIDFYASENAELTITDFNPDDTLAFGHYSAADVAAALAAGQDVNGSFVITFATSNSTVTFTGITSASQLEGHTIIFN